MRCFTLPECVEWLKAHKINGLSEAGAPRIAGRYEILFQAPGEARTQRMLARDVVMWMGEYESLLLWLTDWHFGKPDELAMITALRRSHAELRRLADTPGQLFDFTDQQELASWVFLMISFGWDACLFAWPWRDNMIQLTHQELVGLATADTGHFSQARTFVGKYELDVYRESPAS